MRLKIPHGGGFVDSRLLDRPLATSDLVIDSSGPGARGITRPPVLQAAV